MKVLIIGEFSGFAKNLAKGLQSIGHYPLLFSWGDSFKAIEKDENTYMIDVRNVKLCGKTIKGTNRIKRLISAPKLHHFISQLPHDWDMAIIVNLGFLQNKYNIFCDLISIKELQRLLINKDQIYLSACGGDYVFDKFYPKRKKASPYYIEKSKKNLTDPKVVNTFHQMIGFVKGIIPITISYYEAYKYFEDQYNYKLFPIIPLPFDVDSVSYDNAIRDKIVIMHGINRFHEKGSDFIIPAMEKIKAIYPDKVELKIVTRIPLREYMKIMAEANIVIDQTYASSAGMNAIEAMAMGKVVLGGNEEGNAESLGVDVYPVINIVPDVEQIYSVLEDLILNPKKIALLSQESRKAACEIYDCKKIASQYIDLFDSQKCKLD